MNEPKIISSEISPERADLLKSFSTEELRDELKRREQAGDTGELTSKIEAGVANTLNDGDKNTSSYSTKETKTPDQVELSPEEQFTQEINGYFNDYADVDDLFQELPGGEYIKKSGNSIEYGYMHWDRQDEEYFPYTEYRIYMKDGKVCYDYGNASAYCENYFKGKPYDARLKRKRERDIKPALDKVLEKYKEQAYG